MKTKPTNNEFVKELGIPKSNNGIFYNPIVLILWKNNKKWSIEFVSNNAIHLFGYTNNELMTERIDFKKLIHPDDLQRVIKGVTENRESNSKTFYQFPYRIVCKTGEVKWVKNQISSKRNAFGKITHYHGTIVDVTHIIKPKIKVNSL